MNKQEHFLDCLAEECAEIAQRVSKALRFSLDEKQPGQPLTNGQRINEELRDLIAVAQILVDDQVLEHDIYPSEAQIVAKRAKIENFMAISREHGALSTSIDALIADGSLVFDNTEPMDAGIIRMRATREIKL